MFSFLRFKAYHIDVQKREAYATNFPKVQSIPEIPGVLPFIGHLLPLGGRQKQNDGTIYSRWADQVSSQIFQCRIGNQRSIVVCSWKIVKDLWVTQSNALIDRPHQPGFLDHLGIDISGSPMTEEIKRCRQAAMKALGKPMWPMYYHLLEPSSVGLVKSVYKMGNNGNQVVNIYPYLRQVRVKATRHMILLISHR